jgi:TetR/AcrR family transcriptional regulator, repressor for uid operon
VSARAVRRAAPAFGWPSAPRSPFVRTGPRERQRAATRERLYAAALAEFRRKGFERASVSEIARAAGVSRPSFYAHFPTLDHVLFELTWRLSLEIVQRLAPATDLRATLDLLVDGLIEVEQAVDDPALFREMISIFARRPAVPGIDGGEIPVLGELLRRFERARDAGELRAGMPPERAARLCLSGVFGHLLGVDAAPDERRADLRALLSLFVAR